MQNIPRYLPGVEFPPYTFVPGESPHPEKDPEGHSYGREPKKPEVLTTQNWPEHRDYLYGIDLFNHGYYWEAHEVWEGIWRISKQSQSITDLLHGVIKLAAAGVKARQGNSIGVNSHAAGAKQYFQRCVQPGINSVAGFDLQQLIEFSESVMTNSVQFNKKEQTRDLSLLGITLILEFGK